VRTVKIHSESAQKEIQYLLCQDEASLLFMVNLGCIELNPWSSRLGTLDKPDYIVLDLDPVDTSFDQVIETAQTIRKILEKIEVEAHCKTSGKRGIHVCLPLGARYTYEQARQFAEILAQIVHRTLPKSTSLLRDPNKRQNKVYIDFLQNRHGQTIAAPYSVRPMPAAPISTPLKWHELKNGLDPRQFTIKTFLKRLDRLGDLWKPILGPGIDILNCLKRLREVDYLNS
jgi:bifunctional non-homologous end joining protein LigD